MGFDFDLKIGQYYEKKYIERRGFKNLHYPKDEKFTEYDFRDMDTGFSYEVKSDRKTRMTGNLFLEYESVRK